MNIYGQLYEELVEKAIEQEFKGDIEKGRITEEYARKFIKTYGIIEKPPKEDYFVVSVDFEKLHSKLGLPIQNWKELMFGKKVK